MQQTFDIFFMFSKTGGYWRLASLIHHLRSEIKELMKKEVKQKTAEHKISELQFQCR